MVFLDANLPMYLVGADHPNKEAAIKIIDRMLRARTNLVTDAEVFQEILHRYTSINRPTAIQPAFAALLGIADEVFPINLEIIDSARNLLSQHIGLSARDAVHAASMAERGIQEIVTFDAGFDQIPWIKRVSA